MTESSSAARGRWLAAAVAGAAALLAAAGCGPVTRPPAAHAPEPAPAQAAVGAAATDVVRAIDPRHSEIRILAFRGGALAFLGHNHVLIARDLSGKVRERADHSGGSFELGWPVAALAIDEPAARREAGAEFASVPSAADIAGTRQNLLGPQQLDAAAFTRIRITGRIVDSAATSVAALIELCGRAVALTVPVTIEHRGEALIATGELPLSQAVLGLKPFSVAGGGLQVRDQLQVRFRIVATAAPGG